MLLKYGAVLFFLVSVSAIADETPLPELPPTGDILLQKVKSLQDSMRQNTNEISKSAKLLEQLRRAMEKEIESDSRLSIRPHRFDASLFEPIRTVYFLDGQQVAVQIGKQASAETKPVFEDFIADGCHSLVVETQYRGASVFFPYFSGYILTQSAKESFMAAPGNTIVVESDTKDSGDLTAEALKRPVFELRMGVVPNKLKGKPVTSAASLPILADHNTSIRIVAKESTGNMFQLANAQVRLDGVELKIDLSGANKAQLNDLYKGPVTPGEHKVEVILIYGGDSSLSPQVGAAQFEMKFHQSVFVKAGEHAVVELVPQAKPGQGSPLKKKPVIKFEVKRSPKGFDAQTGGVLVQHCDEVGKWD